VPPNNNNMVSRSNVISSVGQNWPQKKDVQFPRRQVVSTGWFITGLVLLLLIVLGGYYYYKNRNKGTVPNVNYGEVQVGGTNKLCTMLIILFLFLVIVFLIASSKTNNNNITQQNISKLNNNMRDAYRIAGLRLKNENSDPFSSDANDYPKLNVLGQNQNQIGSDENESQMCDEENILSLDDFYRPLL